MLKQILRSINSILKLKEKNRSGPKCEKCGSQMIRMVYGFPSSSMMRDAERGKISLGGCVIFGNDPRWICSAKCDLKRN